MRRQPEILVTLYKALADAEIYVENIHEYNPYGHELQTQVRYM